jgi:signal transduction histidine kinase/CheY-like chemotaxis protein
MISRGAVGDILEMMTNRSATLRVAEIDATGRVLAVDAEWRWDERLAPLAGPAAGPGVDYLDVLERAGGPCERGGREVARELRALLGGARAALEPLEVECATPDGTTTVRVRVARLGEAPPRFALLVEELTERETERGPKARQQEAIARLGVRALATTDPGALLGEAVETVARTLDVEYAEVLELDPEDGTLLLRAGVGWRAGLVGSARIGAGPDTQAGLTLASREPVVVPDLETETRFSAPPLLLEHGIVSCLCAVIHGRGPEQPYGALCAHTVRRRDFTADDVNFLQAVANVVANAVRRAGDERRLREREERLREAQKLEALGRLTAGIAHHFNNLLTAVLGHAEMAFSHARADDRSRRHALEITKAAERAASLVQQLLAFGRRQMREPRVVDLNRLVQRLERLLGALLGETVDLSVRLEPGLASARADPARLEQVVMILAINAKEAMLESGRLEVETAGVVLDEAQAARIPEAQPGAYVLLSIRDTGPGMDAEAVAHAFEPFFTTKGPSHAGLGLSTVYGIVRQTGGAVALESTPGAGTTVRIYLPRAHAAAAPVAATEGPVAAPATAAPPGAREPGPKVLLVEDDPDMREAVEFFLAEEGYGVESAANGREALERLRAGRRPAVILLDLIMPVLDGAGFRAEQARDPDLARIPVVLLTAARDPVDRTAALGVEGYLAKPVEPARLRATVRRFAGAGRR